MKNTALRAESKKAQEMICISDAHEKFYYEKLKEAYAPYFWQAIQIRYLEYATL